MAYWTGGGTVHTQESSESPQRALAIPQHFALGTFTRKKKGVDNNKHVFSEHNAQENSVDRFAF